MCADYGADVPNPFAVAASSMRQGKNLLYRPVIGKILDGKHNLKMSVLVGNEGGAAASSDQVAASARRVVCRGGQPEKEANHDVSSGLPLFAGPSVND